VKLPRKALELARIHGFDLSVSVLTCTTRFVLKMAGSGYRRFARSRLYEYILVVMRFYYCI